MATIDGDGLDGQKAPDGEGGSRAKWMILGLIVAFVLLLLSLGLAYGAYKFYNSSKVSSKSEPSTKAEAPALIAATAVEAPVESAPKVETPPVPEEPKKEVEKEKKVEVASEVEKKEPDKPQDIVVSDEKSKDDLSKLLAQADSMADDEEQAFKAIKLAEKALYDLAKTDDEKKQADVVLKKAQAKFAARRPWAAVVDFNVDKSVESKITGSAVAVKLEQYCDSLCRLVTRANFAKAMKELQFQSTDLVDNAKAKQFGKMVGAEYLVTGSVVQVGDEITIAAQLFHVETGVIKQTAEVSAADINEFNYLFQEITRILAMNDAEKKAYLTDKFNYPKHLADGNAAMLQEDYENAVKSFKMAIAAKRTPEAERALKSAEAKNKTKLDLQQRKKVYELTIAEAKKALDDGKFADAEQAYKKILAMKGYENDSKAQEGLRIAQGGDEVKRKHDAAKAEYESAMKSAKELLDKATSLGEKSPEGFDLCDGAMKALSELSEKFDKSDTLSASDKDSIAKLKSQVTIFKSKISIAPSENSPAQNSDWTVPDLGMELVWIKDLKGWVGKYEVTNSEFRKFKPEHSSKEVNGNTLNGDRQPVVFVNYDDAQEYIKWVNDTERKAGRLPVGYQYRLPGKDEWTACAQCGDGREFPWGDTELPKFGNFNKIEGYEDEFAVTCPVEKSGKNDWGLYGLGGNIWELTQKSAKVPAFDAWRGGSWDDADMQGLRSTVRNSSAPLKRSNFGGFRLVLMPTP